MQILGNSPLSLEQMTDQYLSGNHPQKAGAVKTPSFQEILERKTIPQGEGLRFSKHAAGRLQDRNISLTPSQLERLNRGTEKASQKGIKESLVLMDSLAFIVNVPNQTVVTAMDQTETNENIFTNIDGAVII